MLLDLFPNCCTAVVRLVHGRLLLISANDCLNSACAQPARPGAAALAPVHRQVRVPSPGSEPETMGHEDDDPGVRLEVREGPRGRRPAYVGAAGAEAAALSLFPRSPRHPCFAVLPPPFFSLIFLPPPLVCRKVGGGGGRGGALPRGRASPPEPDMIARLTRLASGARQSVRFCVFPRPASFCVARTLRHGNTV